MKPVRSMLSVGVKVTVCIRTKKDFGRDGIARPAADVIEEA